MKRHSIFKKLEKPKPPPPLSYFKDEVDDPLFETTSSTDPTTTVCCCPCKDEVISLRVAIARLEKIASEQSRLLQRISTKVNTNRMDDSDNDDDYDSNPQIVRLTHLSELVRFPITTDEELVEFDETLSDREHHQRVVSTPIQDEKFGCYCLPFPFSKNT